MNSTLQNIGINAVLAPDKPLQSTVSKSQEQPGNKDKSLNNNKFSDVLERQKARDGKSVEASGKHANKPPLSAEGVDKDVAADSLTETPATDSGNPLPVDGQWLPSELHLEGLESQWRLSSKMTTAGTDMKGDGSIVNTGSAAIALHSIPDDMGIVGSVGVINSQTLANVVSLASADASGPQSSANLGLFSNSDQLRQVIQTSITANKDPQAFMATAGDTQLSGAVNPLVAAAESSVQSTFGLQSNSTIHYKLDSQIASTTFAAALADGLPAANIDNSQPSIALLSPLEALPANRASAEALLQTSVPIEVGKQGWNDAVLQKVMWMSSQQINRAEITLDPPELGSLHVRISTQGDQTSVAFTSHHATVREALDQSLPKLREMLENQGLDLTDVNVTDQGNARQQQADNTGNSAFAEGKGSSQADIEEEADNLTVQVSSLGLVDQYV